MHTVFQSTVNSLLYMLWGSLNPHLHTHSRVNVQHNSQNKKNNDSDLTEA